MSVSVVYVCVGLTMSSSLKPKVGVKKSNIHLNTEIDIHSIISCHAHPGWLNW